MTIEEIRDLINEAEYEYIGIRADERDLLIHSTMMIIQNYYTHIFRKAFMPDSMMPENLTERVHLE